MYTLEALLPWLTCLLPRALLPVSCGSDGEQELLAKNIQALMASA